MFVDVVAPVVVADADPVSALVLAEILAGVGLRTELAADITALTGRLADRSPAAVLLVTPLTGASLPTALATVAAAAPAAVRLVLTDADGAEARAHALDVGADAVLTLPVHPGELRAQLSALLRRSTVGTR